MTRLAAAAAALVSAAVVAAPAAADQEANPLTPCSPSASLRSFTDQLNKTTFGGQAVGGLSALARTGGNQALALVDNQGITPARFFTLKLKTSNQGKLSAETTKSPRSSALTARPSPARTSTARAWSSSPTARSLRPPRPSPSSAASTRTATSSRSSRRRRASASRPTARPARTSPLVLERGFDGTHFSSKLFQVFLDRATDVSGVAALNDSSPFLHKKLLLDVGQCPDGAALLDNIEGMALGDDLGDGRREVTLISDDNFNAAEVTRLYDFSIRLTKEPILELRATYPATQMQPGPISGTSGVDPDNGMTPPFNGQPIPGFSGALLEGPDRYLAMPDNGFGTKGNSRDFLLRVYKIRTDNASEKITVDGFLSLRDPDKKIPFEIVNQNTSDRLLTGGDFDIEAIARDRKGDLWFGDEFGPYLLHTDATGKVLDAPFALAGAKSPSSPDLAPGEQPTVQGSRGWEAVAASKDGRTLYPILEGYRLDDPVKTRRYIYEFDVATKRYTGRRWAYRADDPTFQIGDMQPVGKGNQFLLIERDDFEAPPPRRRASCASTSTASTPTAT